MEKQLWEKVLLEEENIALQQKLLLLILKDENLRKKTIQLILNISTPKILDKLPLLSN